MFEMFYTFQYLTTRCNKTLSFVNLKQFLKINSIIRVVKITLLHLIFSFDGNVF